MYNRVAIFMYGQHKTHEMYQTGMSKNLNNILNIIKDIPCQLEQCSY